MHVFCVFIPQKCFGLLSLSRCPIRHKNTVRDKNIVPVHMELIGLAEETNNDQISRTQIQKSQMHVRMRLSHPTGQGLGRLPEDHLQEPRRQKAAGASPTQECMEHSRRARR